MKNSIQFWSDLCLEIVRRDFTKKADGAAAAPDQFGPTRTARALAIIHLAMHDAFFGTTAPASTYHQKLGVLLALPTTTAPMSVDSAMGSAAAITMLTL